MKEIKLYDPTRKPASWMEIIQPGQYAIFHIDASSCEECTADGRRLGEKEEGTCLIFDNKASAETYAQKKIAELPHIICELYDHHGKGRDPVIFVNDLKRSFYAGTSKYQRDIFWGAIFFPTGIITFFIISWWEGWVYAFAPIIGSKFVIIGLIRLFGGISKWHSASGKKIRLPLTG